MALRSGQSSDLVRIRSDVAGLAVSLGWLKFERALLHKYRTDQPREPAGNPGGGRWVPEGPAASGADPTGGSTRTEETITEDGSRVLTLRIRSNPSADWVEQHTVVSPDGERTVFETSGLTQTIRDGETGAILARSTLTREGAEPEAFVQSVRDPRFLQRGVARALEAAGTLFAVLSGQNGDGETAIFATSASQYKPGIDEDSRPTWVGRVSQKELDSACPRNGEVQELADDASAKVKLSGNYLNVQDFGNKVHLLIAQQINDRNDPNFIAEKTYVSSGDPDARYGTSGSIRLDVLERSAPTTVCVYDHKVGTSGLRPQRVSNIAFMVQRNFPGTQRIIVIEVRPRL